MKLKKVLLVFTLFIIYFLINSFSYSYAISKNLEENIFRLRIVANSNSIDDQELKLVIRNNILAFLENANLNSKQDTINYLTKYQSDLEKIITSTISEYGKTYSFTYEISNSFYPQKKYNNIFLPAGNYDGLQIKLGKATGKNWWCILFPELCLIDSQTCKIDLSSNNLLNQNLNSESINIINKNDIQYKFKFKIIDFINNL